MFAWRVSLAVRIAAAAANASENMSRLQFDQAWMADHLAPNCRRCPPNPPTPAARA